MDYVGFEVLVDFGQHGFATFDMFHTYTPLMTCRRQENYCRQGKWGTTHFHNLFRLLTHTHTHIHTHTHTHAHTHTHTPMHTAMQYALLSLVDVCTSFSCERGKNRRSLLREITRAWAAQICDITAHHLYSVLAICAFTYKRIYIYLYICICIHICTRTYICIYIYIYVCIYIYIFTRASFGRRRLVSIAAEGHASALEHWEHAVRWTGPVTNLDFEKTQISKTGLSNWVRSVEGLSPDAAARYRSFTLKNNPNFDDLQRLREQQKIAKIQEFMFFPLGRNPDSKFGLRQVGRDFSTIFVISAI